MKLNPKTTQVITEDELTDMFGEGGKEEVKEYYTSVKEISKPKGQNMKREKIRSYRGDGSFQIDPSDGLLEWCIKILFTVFVIPAVLFIFF